MLGSTTPIVGVWHAQQGCIQKLEQMRGGGQAFYFCLFVCLFGGAVPPMSKYRGVENWLSVTLFSLYEMGGKGFPRRAPCPLNAALISVV